MIVDCSADLTLDTQTLEEIRTMNESKEIRLNIGAGQTFIIVGRPPFLERAAILPDNRQPDLQKIPRIVRRLPEK